MSFLEKLSRMILHDVMSITKAALGLAYAHSGADTSQPLWPAWVDSELTIADVLLHRAGMHDDDGPNVFDYWTFRKAVKHDATAYAETLLRNRKGQRGEFGYSNLAWQLLARRFEEITGRAPNAVLEEIIGAGGWVWEKDKAGCCLGPHGLRMTTEAAARLGNAAQVIFRETDFQTPTPEWFWPNENAGSGPRTVHNGWFAYKLPVFMMYASGFKAQYVAVCRGETHVQLRGDTQEKFDNEPSEQEYEFLSRVVHGSIAQGKVILAPSGTGKSTWIENHPGSGWEDADILFDQSTHFEEEATYEQRKRHYMEIDKKLEQARQEGKKVMSGLFWNFVPDAIVIPDETLHRQYVAKRKDLPWKRAKQTRKYLQRINAPKFKTIDEAVDFLEASSVLSRS